MKQLLIFSIFCIVIAACSDGSNGQAVDQPTPSPPSPPPVAQDYDSSRDPDLEGRDVDGDGIRDDVQFWLDRELPSDNLFFQDYLRLAGLLQDVLLERGDYVNAYAETIGVGECIIRSADANGQSAISSAQMIDRLRHKTFNTLERIEQFFAVDDDLSLRAPLLSEGESLELCGSR